MLCWCTTISLQNDAWSTYTCKKMSFFLFLKDHGQTKPKPKPRGAKKLQKLTAIEQEGESRCLFRATNGKKKLSTIVNAKDVNRFQLAYANVLKANMDNLKKRDKRTEKSKAKKSKATQ